MSDLKQTFLEQLKSRFRQRETGIWLSEAERKSLEEINRKIEEAGSTGYLGYYFWDVPKSLEPESAILKLAQNFSVANDAILKNYAKDQLTGLWRRNVVFEFLEQAIQKSHEANARATCVALLDIDHMKHVNDILGLTEGDKSLVKMTQVLKTNLQPWHFIGRIGGNTFLAVLNISLDETRALMEKIQTEIAELNFGLKTPTTISIVLSLITQDDTQDSCMTRVEGGMQHAKNTRRNDIWIA